LAKALFSVDIGGNAIFPLKVANGFHALCQTCIVIAAYDGVSLLDLAGPLEAFSIASAFRCESDAPVSYDCVVASILGGPVKTADGVALVTESMRSFGRKTIDTLIVPGAFAVENVTRDPALVQWVRDHAASCRRVCSVCVGSFLLAAAGVLDGRRTTTHWMYAPLLAARYPRITVEPEAIFIRDGAIWSSAGVTTGIDLALALIEQDAGRDLAMKVARILVVYLRRSGGQSQYSALLAAQTETESEAFSELERWIAEHPNSDLRVDSLAERVHMSSRNFIRAYAAKRGRTPAKAVEAIRVDAARRQLEETNNRIESIANACGFSGEEQMRCAFLRNIKIPPREYRRHFASVAIQGPMPPHLAGRRSSHTQR
jgi:transcriptional regulator GlxA family with amidase domain